MKSSKLKKTTNLPITFPIGLVYFPDKFRAGIGDLFPHLVMVDDWVGVDGRSKVAVARRTATAQFREHVGGHPRLRVCRRVTYLRATWRRPEKGRPV